MIARAARADDCAGAVACALTFTRYECVRPTAAALHALFDDALACGGMFVAEEAEQIIGVLCALRQPHPFTGRDFINVLAWWVPREHRDTGAGLALLRVFLKWASTQRVDLVTLSTPLLSSVGHVLRSHHYVPVETVWMKGS